MRSIPRRNSHELALLNGESVLAQELENHCGGDPDHSWAREVVRSGDEAIEGLLFERRREPSAGPGRLKPS